jgi:hypothetical protein
VLVEKVFARQAAIVRAEAIIAVAERQLHLPIDEEK